MNFFTHKFPNFQGPLNAPAPPQDLSFYKKMRTFLYSTKGNPEKVLEASKKIEKFLRMTDLTEVPLVKDSLERIPFLNRDRITIKEANELYIRMDFLLEQIVNDWNDDYPSQYSKASHWSRETQELVEQARIIGRPVKNLVSLRATSKAGLEGIVPGGEGPMSEVAGFLTGIKGTSRHWRTGQQHTHSIEAKNQLKQVKNKYNRIKEQLTIA
jgi:hypothetical protein